MKLSQAAYARNLEASRAWKERNRAKGLTGNGTVRKRGAPKSKAPAGHKLDTRTLALEAIMWMAAKRRDPAHLLGVHAFAANLPAEWWFLRDRHSIAIIIEAIEQEMENYAPTDPP